MFVPFGMQQVRDASTSEVGSNRRNRYRRRRQTDPAAGTQLECRLTQQQFAAGATHPADRASGGVLHLRHLGSHLLVAHLWKDSRTQPAVSRA